MIIILGYSVFLPAGLEFLGEPLPVFIINLVVWFLIALLVNAIVLRLLRALTRSLPGEVEDIFLGIISRPLVILIVLYGFNQSLQLLPLLPVASDLLNTFTITGVVLLVTHILGRFIRDIFIYYGGKWAARTETRVDDVIIPILNLFSPLVLALTAALIILPLWGINITSVLLGAGVLGLVLGLALQETLGNIFSGLSLLIEAPFRKGDLVLFDDGRTCEVLHLGMRSTTLFSLDEQATIFIPNKTLTSGRLINLTKPTPEQRYFIDVIVKQPASLARLNHLLVSIADGHPAVLSSNIGKKLESVRNQNAHIRSTAHSFPQDDPARQLLTQEAERNEQNLVKLEAEGELNNRILALKEALRHMIRGIESRESKGLNAVERQELFCNYITPAEKAVEQVIEQAKTWYEFQDAWLNSNDYWTQRKLWEGRNELLRLSWERLKKALLTQDDRRELRLDDQTKHMLEWLEKEYKLPPGYWKNPTIAVKSVNSAEVHLQLWYYVDNIRLEHDSRPLRVRTELSRIIQERIFSADPEPLLSPNSPKVGDFIN